MAIHLKKATFEIDGMVIIIEPEYRYTITRQGSSEIIKSTQGYTTFLEVYNAAMTKAEEFIEGIHAELNAMMG